ncbi:transcription factor TGA2.2-like isoform X1 [Musa acuminata AAA Group]|uniref:transcription factor TGA2.2-like isoform X1 n=1 Tax=Musa acuminata AAA Group TaxID=214697 RepID=UPI0031DA6159
MVHEGEEETRMANYRVGETGLSDSGPSTRSVADGIHGTTPQAATNFFDQEGAAYFGELEKALMQGVDGIRETEEDTKAFFATRPATLEIFPSWPMRSQQTPRGKTRSANSTDLGSAQDTTTSHLGSDSTASRRASSDQSADQEQAMMTMMIAGDGSITGTTPTSQLASQEKRKMTGSAAGKDGKKLDAKRNSFINDRLAYQTLRRLAQNREAARKSRLRKKAYVQQLESSRIRLQQLEHDLQRARSQGLFLGVAGSANGAVTSGAAMFDVEYARWLDENCKHMSDLRGAMQAHLPDGNLGVIVDQCIANYDELFRLKEIVAKSDVFHLLNGTWMTPAERCFLWMGGFRPSELLEILMPHLDPLTEQQLLVIGNLRLSSRQAEEALSQGLEQLHRSLSDTVTGDSLSDGVDVGNYMGHMALALGKLANLEGFVRQADNLRQQTLHQLRRNLTIKQAARCFLAIGEYYTRLRALSSLWASRPRQSLIVHDSVVSSATDLQIVHQPLQNHFTSF